MSVLEMPRAAFNSIGKGGIFHQTITMTADTYSDSYIMPYFDVSGIAAKITGDGAIQFTNDPPEVINLGTEEWEDWDGFSLINTGLVAFRLRRASGTVVGKVTLRTPIV